MSESGSSTPCANHPDHPAIAVCSLCKREICIHCHGVALNGYAVCKGCPVAEGLRPKTAWESATGVGSYIYGFFHTAVDMLSGPRRFFLDRPFGSPVYALVFGYIALLIGNFFGVLWNSLFLGQYQEIVQQAAEQLDVSVEVAKTLNFVMVPVKAGLTLFLHTIALHLSLSLVGGSKVSLRAVSYLSGYAMAAFLFQLIPPIFDYPIGHLLAMVWVFNAEVNAAQTRFGLPFFRALFAVLVPFLLLSTLSG